MTTTFPTLPEHVFVGKADGVLAIPNVDDARGNPT
jgi:hypothetical protein